MKNTVFIDFLSTFLDSIGVFDCRLPVVFHAESKLLLLTLPCNKKFCQTHSVRLPLNLDLKKNFHRLHFSNCFIFMLVFLINTVDPDEIFHSLSISSGPTIFYICSLY